MLWGRIKFSCHFLWGKKNKTFKIFDNYDLYIYTTPILKTNFYQWTVQENGIYLTNTDHINYGYVEWWMSKSFLSCNTFNFLKIIIEYLFVE